jgi:hypothetical protein
MRNERLHNLCFAANITRVIKTMWMGWTGHVARMEEMIIVYKILVGKPEAMKQVGRPRLYGSIIINGT